MTATEGLNDDGVLDGVFDRETPPETVDTTESTEAARARDERGRFAAKTEPEPQAQALTEPAPVEQPQAPDPNANRHVPLSELLSERKQRQEKERLYMEADARAKAYEQMLQRQPQQPQYQPQPQAEEPPDFYTNPEGALQFHLQRQQHAYENMMLNQSEVMARDKFGDEIVDTALKAAQAAGVAASFKNQPHPWGEMVKWHKRQQTLQVVGDDPDAYRTKIEAEVRAKVLAELKAGGAGAAAPTRIPGTLATATGQGEQGAHLTEEAAMGSIFSSARNRKQG
jgi:hypothetical protein